MNAKVLSSVSAALIVASFVAPASAETLGEHPAVMVAQTWNNRAIDTNTFIVRHPASTQWVAEAPKSTDEPAHAGKSPDLHWSAAIGTGYTARATDSTSSVKPNAATPASQRGPASPDWTATIGTGTAATSRSTEPDGNGTVSSASRTTVAAADWTSRIGSGHPFDSASSATYTTVANTR
jgi:hypothetical protein